MQQRGIAIEVSRFAQAQQITKDIRKSKQKDRRKQVLDAVSKDLDERDRWMRIRQLRKGFSATPYSQRTKEGKHVPKPERAKHSAEYLATEIWKDKRTDAEKQASY